MLGAYKPFTIANSELPAKDDACGCDTYIERTYSPDD